MISRPNRTWLRVVTAAALSLPGQIHGQATQFTGDLLTQARALARAVPGNLPRALHYLKFAETKVPLSAIVEGAGADVVTVAYGVFQVRYADGWIMIDAGVDRATEPDTTVTFSQAKYDRMQSSLRDANLILVTHEHHDHVAGVIRTPTPDVVMPKTVLTRSQIQTLLDRPNIPAIRLTPGAAARYLVIDYDRLYPIAPGVVLIKAPGHTPGSQIIYVRLLSGQETLFIGDIVWNMEGLKGPRQKPAGISGELGEDRTSLQQELDWLAALTRRGGIVLVNAHDDAWLEELARRGMLKRDLDLAR